MPEAVTEKVTLLPVETVWLWGSVVIAGQPSIHQAHSDGPAKNQTVL
jgi:hypothetical protein